MGKKRSRATQTSAGIVGQGQNSMGRRISKETRREYMASGDRLYNQLKAFKRGRNVVVTIPNPNTNETNKRFIRVSGKDYFRSAPSK